MRVHRTVVVNRPIDQVFAYLTDFTHTPQWDPGTIEVTRSTGDGGTGTRYAAIAQFAGRRVSLDYVVTVFEPHQRFVLEAETKTMLARDTMTFREAGVGTSVTYEAEFVFSGGLKYSTWLLSPLFTRLGDKAEAGLRAKLADEQSEGL